MRKCLKTRKTCMTKSLAKQELAFCKMAFNNGNEEYRQKRFYKCEYCNYYHLTSKN